MTKDQLLEKIEQIKNTKQPELNRVCENCSKWYKNNHGGGDCVWNNKEVPKKNDFCSRFEKNI